MFVSLFWLLGACTSVEDRTHLLKLTFVEIFLGVRTCVLIHRVLYCNVENVCGSDVARFVRRKLPEFRFLLQTLKNMLSDRHGIPIFVGAKLMKVPWPEDVTHSYRTEFTRTCMQVNELFPRKRLTKQLATPELLPDLLAMIKLFLLPPQILRHSR